MNKLLCKKTNELSKKKKKGFTLVELIIVIAIIAILAAIAIPKMGAVRESANSKDDLAAAKNISTIVATQIADGSTSTDLDITDVDATIKGKLDGSAIAKTGGASNKGNDFKYKVVDGNISVYYADGTTKLYPIS